MSKQAWLKSEIKEFDRLIDKSESRDQAERVSGRFELRAFIAKHGKEKCDAMWAYMEANGGKP